MLVVIVFIFNLLIHIELPLYYNLETINGTNKTICSIPYYMLNVHTWIYFACSFTTTLVIINILNFKMISYLMKTRNGLNLNNSNRRSIIKDRKFAISAICINIANFISKIPLSVSLLISYYLEFSIDSVRSLFTICVAITTLYYAVSFVIYMMVNSIFYDEFFLMIGLRKSKISQINIYFNNNQIKQNQT